MRSLVFLTLALFAAGPVFAQEEDEAKKTAAKEAEDEPQVFTQEATGTFNGVEVSYTIIAGETLLENDEGEPQAVMFSTSYLRKDVDDPVARPVTFLWNGGPGSSSVWLHMGAFGPKRVDVPSDARDDAGPPYRLLDNTDTILDVTDMVFIDPVGTGFSRPRGEAEGEDFYGVRQDARSVAQFIRLWIQEHGRWNSPKFIGGESYGTTRSAAVVRELEGGFDDVAINGIILISTILDFTIDQPVPGNEIPYLVHLPTMATTAQFHGKAGEGIPVAEFAQEAREFALGEYAHALLKGEMLEDGERERIREQLAYFTGLSETYLENSNLRIRPERFQKELLRDRGLTVGRLDSRYTGKDVDAAGESPDIDPSFYGIDGAYTAAINSYLREDLGVDIDRRYNIIGGLGGSWDWDLGRGRGTYLNVASYIGDAMRQNSGLHVFVAAGYYDFATPFHGAEYSLNRSGIIPERVHFEYYESGHMMYIHHPSLAKLLGDVRTFITGTLAP
jgi:carboxypeptidase C (cathepsin A)